MSGRQSEAYSGQQQLAEAIMWVSMWGAGGIGSLFVVLGIITRNWGLLGGGLLACGVSAIAVVQRHRPRSRPWLLLAALTTACGVGAPLLDPPAQIGLIPALTLFAFAGIFSLPRASAFKLAIWCGIISVWSVPWLMPGLNVFELMIAGASLTALGAAGWRLLSLAGDVMVREEESHRLVFDSSPVAILEQDFAGVVARLAVHRQRGIDDIRAFLKGRPDEVRKLIGLVVVRRANPAALQMLGAESAAELTASFSKLAQSDSELAGFVEQFVAIWEERWNVALDVEGPTLEGDRLEGVLHWSVPLRDGEPDVSRVIVTVSDIAPRKVVEERLAEAVEANRRMVAFERAIGQFSRALVLGSGEHALETALDGLRETIGSDRAYLAINIDDPELGPAFRLVTSVNGPEHSADDWLGSVVPWSRYPMAAEPLSMGQAFRYSASDSPEGGWNRSLLSVPVFSGGDWIGCIGFVDIDRRTVWSDEAVRMLEVASPMIGTYWERDITREKLRAAQEQLDEASRLEAIGRLAAGIAHEINTPMQYIGDNTIFLRKAFERMDDLVDHATSLGHASGDELTQRAASLRERYDTLKLDAVRRRIPAAIETSLEGVEAVSRIVRAMKDFSHPGGEIMAHIDLNAALRTTMLVSRNEWRYVAELTTDLDPSNPTIPGFPGELNQVFLNMLVNAGHAIADRRIDGMGLITVATRRTDQFIEVEIRDNGIGIPPEAIGCIFEPFFTTKEVGRGTGQGLAISHQIVTRHQGTITVESEVGVGTSFAIRLPAVADGVAA